MAVCRLWQGRLVIVVLIYSCALLLSPVKTINQKLQNQFAHKETHLTGVTERAFLNLELGDLVVPISWIIRIITCQLCRHSKQTVSAASLP